jgi:hypothetical protein
MTYLMHIAVQFWIELRADGPLIYESEDFPGCAQRAALSSASQSSTVLARLLVQSPFKEFIEYAYGNRLEAHVRVTR